MFRLGKKWRNRIFEGLFWLSILVGLILMILVLTLGWQLFDQVPQEIDAGVVLATGALALFTAFLWCSAAITARFARAEISTSSAVSSADLTLKLDNRFNSDRALRIRHGAVKFLAQKRNVKIACDHNISPYGAERNSLRYGLSSDLIDLFNFFDWIGYLTSYEGHAIDREVVRQKLGPWIINYYDMCRAEIDVFRENHPDRWVYLAGLYEDLIMGRKKWYAAHIEPLPRLDDEEELNAFLRREHARSHRGFNPPPSAKDIRQNSLSGSEAF
jgi:hypothetical protein